MHNRSNELSNLQSQLARLQVQGSFSMAILMHMRQFLEWIWDKQPEILRLGDGHGCICRAFLFCVECGKACGDGSPVSFHTTSPFATFESRGALKMLQVGASWSTKSAL